MPTSPCTTEHIIHRLEAVTSRLEDVYNVSQTAQVIHDEPDPNAQARAAAAAAAGPPPVHPPPPPAPVEQPPSVIAFETQIMQGKVKPFIQLTDALAAPSVIEQVCSMYQYLYHLTNQPDL